MVDLESLPGILVTVEVETPVSPDERHKTVEELRNEWWDAVRAPVFAQGRYPMMPPGLYPAAVPDGFVLVLPSSALLITLLGVVKGYLKRQQGRSVKMTLDKDNSIELKGLSKEETDLFVARFEEMVTTKTNKGKKA